jgi:pimeloyl-ACP methyl ester carboxylesterase
MRPFIPVLVLCAAFAVAAPRAQAPASEPLSVARQGYFFAGGQYSVVNGRRVLSGQLYAEFQIPARQTARWPIVMVHGGGQSGTNFTGTPDGREGWAQFFLRRGYAVYVVDQPGRGRAAYETSVYGAATQVNLETIERRFVAPERFNLWPQARLHTQWPGQGGAPGDAASDQFLASQLPSIQDFARQQTLNRDALLALLERIGPAVLLTHSQSGAFGWPVADARPDLVKAIVAVEPNGPPFFAVENVPAPEWFRDAPMAVNVWGITAVPLSYEPRAAAPSELAIVREDRAEAPDLVRCWLQREPARQLPKLAGVPTLVLTAEASYHAPYDHCTVKYLRQAGLKPTWIRLADAGIRGNGHMMMLEKNNHEIAARIAGWLADAVPAASSASAAQSSAIWGRWSFVEDTRSQ